jgi:peptidoglycan/LPS O-acetylase OafA/YrhL
MPQVEEGRFSSEGSVHLDALRGLAALVVVLGHTRSLYFSSSAAAPAFPGTGTNPAAPAARTAPSSPPPVPSLRITMGNEAVMIFFVLSGFLVGGSVLRSFRKGIWSWSDYLTKRLTRLWVVLVPALVLGYAIDHAGIRIFGPHSIYGSPPGQLIVNGDLPARLGLPTLVGNLFFTQGILTADFGVNESLWSLAFEFWYYLLFPLLAVMMLGRARPVFRLLALAGFAAIGYFVGPWIMAHLPIWMLGALVAWLPLRLSEPTARRLALATSLVLVAAMPLMRKVPVSVYQAEWVFALLSGCLIYLVKHLTRTMHPGRRHLGWYAALSGFFSRISYTLYLVHLPLAVFVCGLLNRPWHIWAKTGPNLALWFAMNVAVVGVAYLFYRLFEANTDPVRKSVARFLARRKIAF